MSRNRPAQRRGGTTLGDAISSKDRNQLHQLRDTLQTKVQEAIASQRAEPRPPWRKKQKRTNVVAAAPQEMTITVDNVTPRQSKSEFEYWDFPDEAEVKESPPISITDAQKLIFNKILQAGINFSTTEGEDLHLIVGLDFGTSSTKTIVRLPYEPDQPTIAIPAPTSCRSNNNAYLWQTVLWLVEDGSFCPWPQPRAAVMLRSLKQGLIQGRSEAPISKGAVTVSRAQASVAYLAFVIRYVKGWLSINRPELFRERRPVWFLNLGMPAESFDDQTLAKPYRHIGVAALQLAKTDTSVTAEATQLFLNDSRVIETSESEEAAEKLGVYVIPETAAEMTGFAQSVHGAPGLYLLVDVGAMTLDVCMFRLSQITTSEDQFAFMTARVRPLGVDSFHWFSSTGKSEPEFAEQCDRTLRAVVWATRMSRDPYAECWNPGNSVPIFLAGGGANHKLHYDIVKSLGPWLQEHTSNNGIQLLELKIPETIDIDHKTPLHDFRRMAVAWGLSYPQTEIGRIITIPEIEDIPPRTTANWEQNYIGPEQT